MGTVKNIPIGTRFGLLSVIAEGAPLCKPHRTHRTMLCQCDCGKLVAVQNRLLLSGTTKSCGCLKKIAARKREAEHPRKLTTIPIGRKFGRLTVIGEASPVLRKDGRRISRSIVECSCSKKRQFAVRNIALLSGATKSCGCLKSEVVIENLKKRVPNKTRKGGYSKTRLYGIFRGIHKRCEYPHHHAYDRYGGRGIKVCKEWDSFLAFREWSLANGYADNLTIDRINNDGDYAPSNCRWVSYTINARNKPNVRSYEYQGERLYFGDIVQRTGLSKACIWHRLKAGWPMDDIMETVSYRGNDIKRGITKRI